MFLRARQPSQPPRHPLQTSSRPAGAAAATIRSAVYHPTQDGVIYMAGDSCGVYKQAHGTLPEQAVFQKQALEQLSKQIGRQ